MCFKDSRRLLPSSHLIEKQAQRRILRLSKHDKVGSTLSPAPCNNPRSKCHIFAGNLGKWAALQWACTSRMSASKSHPACDPVLQVLLLLALTLYVIALPAEVRAAVIEQVPSCTRLAVGNIVSLRKSCAHVQSKDAMERLLTLAAEVHSRRTTLHLPPGAAEAQVCCLPGSCL